MLLIHNMLLVLLIFRANIFMIRIIEQSKMFEVYLKYLSINHQLIERKKTNSKYLKIKNIIKRGTLESIYQSKGRKHKLICVYK